MDQKTRLLTIGQFAALHGINKKTLMWYDEIGLFKPAFVHPENGYRFYNYHQSSLLETILMLRDLDVSVGEIREFVKHRSAGSLKSLLDEKIPELDVRLSHLKAVRKTLCNHRQNMETLLTMDLDEFYVVRKEACSLVTVNIDRETSYDRAVEMIVAKTREYELRRLHDASYGTMIPVKSLRLGDYDDYCGLFIEIPFSIQKAGLHIQPCGTYLRTFFRGNWKEMSDKYQELFAFAKKHGLEPFGFSYETIINETVTDHEEDYIVQIEIPVRRQPEERLT